MNGLTRAIAVDYASVGHPLQHASAPATSSTSAGTPTSTPRCASDARRSTSPGSAWRTTSRYAAVYLASRESEFVTGINLPLDGGSSAARGAVLG